MSNINPPGDFRQSADFKPNFDKKAYHDETTGHYTMPEDDNSIPSSFLDKSGLYLPTPKGKEVTHIIWDIPPMAMEVAESVDEVLAILDGNTEFVEFTHPVFEGMKVKVNRRLAKLHCFIVETVFKDMEAERMNVQAFELNKRMQAQQVEQARIASLHRGNRRN